MILTGDADDDRGGGLSAQTTLALEFWREVWEDSCARMRPTLTERGDPLSSNIPNDLCQSAGTTGAMTR